MAIAGSHVVLESHVKTIQPYPDDPPATNVMVGDVLDDNVEIDALSHLYMRVLSRDRQRKSRIGRLRKSNGREEK